MPNIEIHGLSKADSAVLIRRMRDLFEDKSYKGEIVFTFYPTRVYDMIGKSQPFLRLHTVRKDDAAEIYEIIDLLRKLGMEIEHVLLKGFYPKKE